MVRYMTHEYRDFLPSGERLVAYDIDMGGDYWFLTHQAIYILATPSKSNARLGREQTSRIPLSGVLALSVNDKGTFMERILHTEDASGERDAITGWYDNRKIGAWFDARVRTALEAVR